MQGQAGILRNQRLKLGLIWGIGVVECLIQLKPLYFLILVDGIVDMRFMQLQKHSTPQPKKETLLDYAKYSVSK
jgi:hypothetical protein